jgi:hypothetical protein
MSVLRRVCAACVLQTNTTTINSLPYVSHRFPPQSHAQHNIGCWFSIVNAMAFYSLERESQEIRICRRFATQHGSHCHTWDSRPRLSNSVASATKADFTTKRLNSAVSSLQAVSHHRGSRWRLVGFVPQPTLLLNLGALRK